MSRSLKSPPNASVPKLNKLFTTLSKVCAAIAMAIFICVMLYLSAVALVSTVDMNTDNAMLENVVYHADSVISVLFGIALLALLFFVLRWAIERANVWAVISVSSILVLILGAIWVTSSLSAPTHDSFIVSRAAYHASIGDYSYVSDDYFKRFPFQLGYVLWSEWIIKLFGTTDNYLVIEYVNVLCLALSYLALMLSAKKLWGDGTAKMLAVILPLCAQPILFCTFTYGNIPGLAFASLSIWQFLEIRSGWRGYLHGALSALFLGISVALKMNFMIVLAAIAIIGAVRLIRHRHFADLICVALCVVSCLSLPALTQSHYEKRAEVEFGEGIPMASWLAMGLNESYIAPGWYSGKYTVTNFHEHNMDPDAAADASLEVIRERVEVFKNDGQYAADFFSQKIVSQWNEPTYQSLWTNQVRGRYGEMGKIATWALVDKEKDVKAYMSRFQELIFLASAAAALVLIRRRRITDALIPTVFLGGFVYHALFEAKSQYAITYFVFLIPLAAYALNRLYVVFLATWRGKKQELTDKIQKLGGRHGKEKVDRDA